MKNVPRRARSVDVLSCVRVLVLGRAKGCAGRHLPRLRRSFLRHGPADSQSTSSPLKRTMQPAAYPAAAALEKLQLRYRHTVWSGTAWSWPSRLSNSTAPRRPASAHGRRRIEFSGLSAPPQKTLPGGFPDRSCRSSPGHHRPAASGFGVEVGQSGTEDLLELSRAGLVGRSARLRRVIQEVVGLMRRILSRRICKPTAARFGVSASPYLITSSLIVPRSGGRNRAPRKIRRY
jgi:hypothetical protein